MYRRYDNVIVFGPTGAVGSAVACEAARRGANVWLAMRDTTKVVPGLDTSAAQADATNRIRADLADPASVRNAIRASGAKAAYFYQVRAPGGMKSIVEVMKEAGLEYAVFLSTFTIRPNDNLHQTSPQQIISHIHAQVEIALEDAGIAHTVLRPGSFAYNIFRRNLDQTRTPWVANILNPEVAMDCISPTDIGRVGGSVLVNRPSSSSKEVIHLYGPQLLTAPAQLSIIESTTGQKIETHVQTAEEFKQYLLGKGFPEPLANNCIGLYTTDTKILYPDDHYQASVNNVLKYSGHKSTTFEGYVRSSSNTVA